ncbi:Regulatory GAL4 [Hyphodiscus hymeniophilus]|uniref:Regulatory GAL4 n=1 Tax=Hyphodiscus hymeniophilus TaxID=353542 RepID=A0A9P6VD37_9HELO|nr:Regulatory GAL4 [Hyphodiscus hymeniophilus]
MSEGGNDYYAACDPCRTRKFKVIPLGLFYFNVAQPLQCTKERPTCAACSQLGIRCVYSRKISRTPLTRSNLTAAEDRIRLLESALTSLFPGIGLETILSSTQSQITDTPSERTASQPARSSPPDEDEKRNANSSSETLPREADGFDWTETAITLSELSDVSDGMAALSINPEGAGYLGATSSVVPLRTLFSKDHSTNIDLDKMLDWQAHSLIPQQIPFNLPEEAFIDAYFRCYHPTYPFLYEPLFRSQFESKSPRPDSWPILLNAVLALGAWCIGEDESVMDDYFDQKIARLFEARSIFESGNLTSVQALLLLSNYTQKRNRPNTGWNYLGLAVRVALSLGLHKEFPDWEISLLQRETRRRVWWGLFIFDSGASITFGRPVLLPQKGIMDASQVLNISEEQSLTASTTSLPTELLEPTIYTPLICQSLFHLTTNTLHHRLITSPSPSPQELTALNRTIDSWKDSIPSYFDLESSGVQWNETFVFARYRLLWRTWNLKIIVSRPILLRWAARLKDSDPGSSDTTEELRCRKISHEESTTWLDDILTTKGLLTRTAITNRLAARCLGMFSRLSPLFDTETHENVGSWEGTFTTGFSDDQFGGGLWDWANNEMNWTI